MEPPSDLLLAALLGADVLLGLLAIAALLFLSGLVSGSEVAFFSLTPNDYEELEQEPTTPYATIDELRQQPRLLLATILIANNFINIAIVLVSTLILQRLFPEELFFGWAAAIREQLTFMRRFTEAGLSDALSFVITVIGVTFLLVLFGEVAPKVYASYNKLTLVRRMARPVNLLLRLFYPLASSLVQGASFIERRLEQHTADTVAASQEDIDEAIDLTVNAETNGEEHPHDIDILKRIVKFSNVTVRQIMRARGDVTAVDLRNDYDEVMRVARESSYSRIPVFEEDFDQVKGLLYVKDLLGHRQRPAHFDWTQLVRPEVLFVPENKKISDLLRQFQLKKTHMAIVVDEYGGTEGIVTLEDVLEEVIGDIQDEFDATETIAYQRLDDHNYIFEGKTMLGDVYRILEMPAATFADSKGEAESLAGLMLELLGRLPEPGEELAHAGYRFQARTVSARRIEEVLVTLPDEPPTDPALADIHQA